MKLGLIGALGGVILGWWIGNQLVKGQWAEADNVALRAQEQLTADAAEQLQSAEAEGAEALLQLSQAEVRIEHVENELEIAINQAPLVEMVEVSIPGECPSFSCPMPDTRKHFRLWNSAISNSTEALFPAVETAVGDGAVWRSHHFTELDADCRSIDGRGNGAMGPLELDQCRGKWRNSRVLVRASRDGGSMD